MLEQCEPPRSVVGVTLALADEREHGADNERKRSSDHDRLLIGPDATIIMTMRYAHLAPEVAREAVCLLDGLSDRDKTVAKTTAN